MAQANRVAKQVGLLSTTQLNKIDSRITALQLAANIVHELTSIRQNLNMSWNIVLYIIADKLDIAKLQAHSEDLCVSSSLVIANITMTHHSHSHNVISLCAAYTLCCSSYFAI